MCHWHMAHAGAPGAGEPTTCRFTEREFDVRPPTIDADPLVEESIVEMEADYGDDDEEAPESHQHLARIALRRVPREATEVMKGIIEAKPGQEDAVAVFLKSALPIVEREPATLTWYAMRLGPTSFGIYDTFPDDQGREAHLAGQVAAALMQKAPELLASPPVIQKIDILAAKLPD